MNSFLPGSDKFNIQIPYKNIESHFLNFLSSQGVHSFELKPDDKNIFFQGKAKSSSLFLKCDGIIAYYVLVDKCWDKKKIEFFIRSLKEKNTQQVDVIDIGANMGLISRQLLCVADSSISKIYCYEPNKIHFECLIKNLKTFQHIKLHNHAVGNRDGKIKLTSETATQNTRVLLEEGETVILKLDSMDIHNPDMLKIDVEGLEMEVLKGGHKLLENIEFVMIELNNNSKKYGSSNKLIQKHMKNLGFKELIKTWPDIVYRKA